MNFRNFVLTISCALASTVGLYAQGPCMSFMAAGTYVTKITGSAVVATTPLPIFAPVTGIGLLRVDEAGNMTGLSPLTVVVGGTTELDALTASKLTVASDCSVVFKATCAGGCFWEGNGFLLRGGQSKEIHMVFTKTNGYPLTAFVEMKQVSN